MKGSIIQLTRSGTVFSGTWENVERLAAQFRKQNYVRLCQLLEPTLLHLVCHRLEQALFHLQVYEGLGKDLCPDDTLTTSLLNFLCNNRNLFEIVEAITGCGRLGCFVGKVYRMVPHQGHTDSWHDDLINERKVALSINLSPKVYRGGILEIRDPRSRRILSRIPSTGFGDGIIFRIADYLEHRRTPVEGRFAKTAFAGWFKSRPDFMEILKDLHNEPGRKIPD
jgi:hypothetical protein